MSTPCTIRWRAKDWISCLYACKISLDEEPNSSYYSSTPHPKGEKRKKRVSVNGDDQKSEQERESENTDTKGREEESSRWPSFEEEDYIVFCFKDDGEVHVIEERESESQSRPAINRKLTFVEDKERKDTIISIQKSKGGGGNNNRMDRDSTQAEMKERNEIEEETREIKMISSKSSDSNQSDATSTSSFAFPVMHGEWMGSPVHMPRPEGHKSRNVRLHCCRF